MDTALTGYPAYDHYMNSLYPEISPSVTTMFDVGGGHKIYVEESGNRNGIPVIFLHGGPGSGCNENHRRYFNPELYRIVIFDQRGCNRSSPAGATQNNTTQDLLNDIEFIRDGLDIEKWLAQLYITSISINVKGLRKVWMR